MLEPAIQAEVLRLHFTEHLSCRAIAARLNIHRESVRAIIGRKRVVVDRSEGKKRSTLLDPYLKQIDSLLREDPSRSAINILQKLRFTGYLGGVTVLRDYLRSLRPQDQKPKAYLTLDFLPAQAAQADWGDFGDVFGLGRKVWCFVMVLCWSRMLYLEFTLSANFESFIRCHERAFQFFGGVPQECWYDNCSTAVAEHRKKLVRFYPRFFVYTGHHGFKPVACNQAASWEKGRVEDGIKLIRYNFWPGRNPHDLWDLNAQAFQWRDQFANKRTHASTRKIPELMCAEEKKALRPLREPFDTDEKKHPAASHQFRISFDGNLYSVPWRLANTVLTVRANDRSLAIYYGTKCVARHPRCWAKGRVMVNAKHEEGLRAMKPGAEMDRDLDAVKDLGPHGTRYLELIPAQSRSIRSELKRLMMLITVYGQEAVHTTMGRVLALGVVGAIHVERLLTRSDTERKHLPPLQLADPRLILPPTVHDLKSYDALLLETEKGDPNAKAPGTTEAAEPPELQPKP